VKTAENGAQTSRIVCPALRAKTANLSPSRYLAQIEALPILGHAWLASLKRSTFLSTTYAFSYLAAELHYRSES
jgi:hypothetical protein